MSDSTSLFDSAVMNAFKPADVATDRAVNRDVDPDVLIRRPVRNQAFLLPQTLDDRIEPEHPARAIMAVIDALDLRELEADVASNGRTGGRPAVAPQILLALWVYSLSRGEACASGISELVKMHDVYRWICGGVPVRERTISDFRRLHGAAFDRIAIEVIAVLMAEDLVDVTRITQDGTRVRASAGAGSFRRETTLEELRVAAAAHYEAVVADAKTSERSKVAQSAAERGARERLARIGRAQEILKEKLDTQGSTVDVKPAGCAIELSDVMEAATVLKTCDQAAVPSAIETCGVVAVPAPNEVCASAVVDCSTNPNVAQSAVCATDASDRKRAPRASSTDPDATRMKMGDGGFRPAYNVQFATAADGSGVILGVEVTTRGSDQHELTPMREQVERRTGEKVLAHIVDSGFANAVDIEAADAAGTTVYAPLPKKKADPNGRVARERSAAVKAWHARMESDEGKAVYKRRGEIAELSNARAKSRYGLSALTMRGLVGASVCAVLTVVSLNIERLISLRALHATKQGDQDEHLAPTEPIVAIEAIATSRLTALATLP